MATRTEEWEVHTEYSQAAMREETELLSNTLTEVAKAILKDTEDSGKFVDGRSKGMSTGVVYIIIIIIIITSLFKLVKNRSANKY
jgi:hypothetical protein